jgi:hypothetical protein
LVFGGGWPPNLLDDMEVDEFLRWLKIAQEQNDRMAKAQS